jgi:hypothetical protein|tara:strand:+ start:460 stop:660 length:201 start_codon:yes stop_codon:yes gene_type:complete
MNNYKFICTVGGENEPSIFNWSAISKHYYGKSCVPNTYDLLLLKERLLKYKEVEKVVIYAGDTPIL